MCIHLRGGQSDRRDKDTVSREISYLSRCDSACEVAKVPASSCFLQACKRLPSHMTLQLAVVIAMIRVVALPWFRSSLRVVYLGVQVAVCSAGAVFSSDDGRLQAAEVSTGTGQVKHSIEVEPRLTCQDHIS